MQFHEKVLDATIRCFYLAGGGWRREVVVWVNVEILSESCIVFYHVYIGVLRMCAI